MLHPTSPGKRDISVYSLWFSFLPLLASGNVAAIVALTSHEFVLLPTVFVTVALSRTVCLQNTHRKLLDVVNSLGISDSILRLADRRQKGDALLVYGGMVCPSLYFVLLATIGRSDLRFRNSINIFGIPSSCTYYFL